MKNSGKNKAGKFELVYSEGYAELTVSPPEGDGLPVYPEEILGRMKLLGIPSVRLQLIVTIVNNGSSLPERLVEWPEGALLSSKISIKASGDLMTAEATITSPRPGGGLLTLKDIKRELENRNIVFGINEKNIHRFTADCIHNTPFLIASGREPVDGRSAAVEYNFETERLKPFIEMQYGRINLKELNFIQNCTIGDILAELHPAEPAVDGYNIMGTVFPAESSDDPVELKCGSNTYMENNKILAGIKGNVYLENNAVCVEEVVSVDNVDYETGNIDFDGSVDIAGTIADGFSVKASGSIQVGKCIGRAELFSGRSVILKAGINGDKEGKITCRGNLLSKYIESSIISCGGDIIVEEAIMNSQVDSTGDVLLSGRRAEVIGGIIIVGGILHCKKIGNLYDVRTNLVMGIDPGRIENYYKVQKQLNNKRTNLDELDEKLRQLNNLHSRDEHEAGKIARAKSQIEREISETSGEISVEVHKIQQLRNDLIPSGKSYILAEDRIYSGVRISFGLQDHPIPDKGISSSIIYRKGKDIIEVGYNRQEPVLPEELR